MATSTITYTGQLRTEAVHELSGNTIITDAPPDNNGRGEAFSPTDLLATSLGNCMLTIMGILANRIDVNIDGTKAEIVKVMASDPRRVAEVHVTFTMPERDFSSKEKQMLVNAAHTCPVALSLHPDIKQVINFVWAS